MKVRKEGNKGHHAENRKDGKCVMLLRM